MSRLNTTFAQLKADKRKGLIAYLTAGCPDYTATRRAVAELEAAGADVIELGIPFSDPMADGPVIQKAANIALKAGSTTAGVLKLVQEIRQTSSIPLVVMTYVNTVLHYGAERFVREFAAAGLDGLIVPDMPAEEAGLLSGVCSEAGLDLIHFVAPTTTSDRIDGICANAAGFLYCISNTGVTGVREVDYSQIGAVMEVVRQQTPVPLAIGFGIGTPESAQQAARYGDAVIVGSAIMQLIMDEGVEAAGSLIAAIRRGLDKGA